MNTRKLAEMLTELLEVRTALREIRGPGAMPRDEVVDRLREMDSRLQHVIAALGATDAAWDEAPSSILRPVDPDDLHEDRDASFAVLPPGGDIEEAVAGPCDGLIALREAIAELPAGAYEVHLLDGSHWLPWGVAHVTETSWSVYGQGVTLGPGCIIV